MSDFTFSTENQPLVEAHIAKYPEGRQASAVMPLLDLAQRQLGGSLNRQAIEAIAIILKMPPMRVFEVASFYSMYNLEPVGKYHVQVCGTTPCWLRGAEDIMHACQQQLGINQGEVTPDGKFSLIEVECLGACANAPMVQINDDYYEDLTPASCKAILEGLAAGKVVKTGSQIGRRCSEPYEPTQTDSNPSPVKPKRKTSDAGKN